MKEREALKRRTLQLRCGGRSGQRICRNLGISEKTLDRWLKRDTVFRICYQDARQLYLKALYPNEHRKGMRDILRVYDKAVETGLPEILQEDPGNHLDADDGYPQEAEVSAGTLGSE